MNFDDFTSLQIDGQEITELRIDDVLVWKKNQEGTSPSIILSTDKNILSYYDNETATLITTLTDSNRPIEGKTCYIHSDNMEFNDPLWNYDNVSLILDGDGIIEAYGSNVKLYDENDNIITGMAGNTQYIWKYTLSGTTFTISSVGLGVSYPYTLPSNKCKLILDDSVNIVSDSYNHFYYKGVTDSNGQCSVSYVSKGAGVLNIQCESPEYMISSETCSIEDCLYYNDGTNLSNVTIGSGVSCTVNDGALKITTSTNGEKYVFYNYELNNSDNFLFECEVAKLGTIQSVAMVIGSGSNWFAYDNSTKKWSGRIINSFSDVNTRVLTVGDKIKIKQLNGLITLYQNDTVLFSNTADLGSNFKIGHYTNNGRVQYVDNIKIKQL